MNPVYREGITYNQYLFYWTPRYAPSTRFCPKSEYYYKG